MALINRPGIERGDHNVLCPDKGKSHFVDWGHAHAVTLAVPYAVSRFGVNAVICRYRPTHSLGISHRQGPTRTGVLGWRFLDNRPIGARAD